MTAPRDDGAASPYDQTQWAVPGMPTPPSSPPAYPSSPPAYPSNTPAYPSAPPGYPPNYASGYPTPPPPGYGAAPYSPPPAYPAAAGYPPYPGQATGTNGLAIASLSTSIVGIPLTLFCFVGGVLCITGIVLGIVSLNQLKRTQQSGRGMAIAGIAVGAVTLLLYGIFMLIYLVVFAANSH